MSLDTSKVVESVTYNGTAFTLKGGGTTASEVDYTNTAMEGVTNVKGALDQLVETQADQSTDIESLGTVVNGLDTKVQKNTTDIAALTETQQSHSTSIDTLNGEYEELNKTAHTHKNKQTLDWIYLEGESLNYYYSALDFSNHHELQIAPKLGSGSSGTFEIRDNTIINFSGDVTSFAVTFPTTATNRYMSTLSFKSGSTATSFSYPTGIIWSGFDIVNGQFVPVAGKYYEIVFWKNNYGFNATVRGVWA